jgi:hypothetical protein
MAEYTDREHFIPLRKNELIALLLAEPDLAPQDREDLKQFCTLVIATYHFEYHKALERLKDAYAPFDPDADTRAVGKVAEPERRQHLDEFFKEFRWLMERANFEELGPDAVRAALAEASDRGFHMDVDLRVFERHEMFARGDVVETRVRRRWWRLWRREEVPVPLYKRLVLVMKLRRHRRLGRKIDTGRLYLRVYKDIPKVDLEMLIPGARPRMRPLDRANVGVPMASGLIAVLVKTVLLLGGVSGVLALLLLHQDKIREADDKLFTGSFALILAGLLGYAFRSYTSYLHLKNRYERNLSQSLYFQSLDGNAGVLFRLLDEAEEQECREAILGYYFLWRHAGADGWTAAHLDDVVEEWLEKRAGVKVDFEIGDAIDKLEKLRIVEKVGDRYRAQPIARALEMLDWTWDNYFKFNNPEPEEPPIPAGS